MSIECRFYWAADVHPKPKLRSIVMAKRTELNKMSGEHFGKLHNAMNEVAEDIGDVTLAGVADYMLFAMNSIYADEHND